MNPIQAYDEEIADAFSGSRLKQAIMGFVTLAAVFSPNAFVRISTVKRVLGISDAQWDYEARRLAEDAHISFDGERVTSSLAIDLSRHAVGGVSGRPASGTWQNLRAAAMDALFGDCEPYCMACHAEGVSLALDHTVPVSRGGSNHPLNFMWLCVPCNSSKGTKTWQEWMASRK